MCARRRPQLGIERVAHTAPLPSLPPSLRSSCAASIPAVRPAWKIHTCCSPSKTRAGAGLGPAGMWGGARSLLSQRGRHGEVNDPISWPEPTRPSAVSLNISHRISGQGPEGQQGGNRRDHITRGWDAPLTRQAGARKLAWWLAVCVCVCVCVCVGARALVCVKPSGACQPDT